MRYSSSLGTNTSCVSRRLSPLWVSPIIKRFLLSSWHSTPAICTHWLCFSLWGCTRHHANLSWARQHFKYWQLSCPPWFPAYLLQVNYFPQIFLMWPSFQFLSPAALFWRHFWFVTSPWKHTDDQAGLQPPICGLASQRAEGLPPTIYSTPRGPCCLEQPCHMMDGEKALSSLVWPFPLAFLYSLQPWSIFCVWTEFISFLNSTMCKPPGQMLACRWAERPLEKPQEWCPPLWERSMVTWDRILSFRGWGPLTSLRPPAVADAHFLSYLPLWTHRRKTRC